MECKAVMLPTKTLHAASFLIYFREEKCWNYGTFGWLYISLQKKPETVYVYVLYVGGFALWLLPCTENTSRLQKKLSIHLMSKGFK